jgi:hypothetical protein
VVSKWLAGLLSCNTQEDRFGYKPTSHVTNRAEYAQAGLKGPKVSMMSALRSPWIKTVFVSSSAR